MKMDEVEEKNIGHYKVANVSAVLLILCLGAYAFIQIVRRQEAGSTEGLIGFSIAVALVLLIPIYK